MRYACFVFKRVLSCLLLISFLTNLSACEIYSLAPRSVYSDFKEDYSCRTDFPYLSRKDLYRALLQLSEIKIKTPGQSPDLDRKLNLVLQLIYEQQRNSEKKDNPSSTDNFQEETSPFKQFFSILSGSFFLQKQDFNLIERIGKASEFIRRIHSSQQKLKGIVIAGFFVQVIMVFASFYMTGLTSLSLPFLMLWGAFLCVYALHDVLNQYFSDELYQRIEKYLSLFLNKIRKEYSLKKESLPSAFHIAMGESSRWMLLGSLALLGASAFSLYFVSPVFLAFYLPVASLILIWTLNDVFRPRGIWSFQKNFLESFFRVQERLDNRLFLDNSFFDKPDDDWKKQIEPFKKAYHVKNRSFLLRLAFLTKIIMPLGGLVAGYPMQGFLLAMALQPLFYMNMLLQSILESAFHLKSLKKILQEAGQDRTLIKEENWPGKKQGTFNDTPLQEVIFNDWEVEVPGKKIVSGMNLSLRRNENILIQAPSGQGKTTLAKTLCFQKYPQKGQAFFRCSKEGKIEKSEDLKLNEIRRQISYHSFEDLDSTSVLRNLIRDNAAEGETGNLFDHAFSEIRKLIPEFEMPDLDKPFNQFSTGEKRRIKLALFLLFLPESSFIVLDEPFSGLDQKSISKILSYLKSYQLSNSCSFIIIDHHPFKEGTSFFSSSLHLDQGDLLTAKEFSYRDSLNRYLHRIFRMRKNTSFTPLSSEQLSKLFSSPFYSRYSKISDLTGTSKSFVFPKIVAHRGQISDIPENTLEGILKSASMGIDAVEVDIRRTRDNILVLSHDEFIKHPIQGKVRISDLTLKELKNLKIKGKAGKTYEYVALKQVAEIIRNLKLKIELILDLKPDQEWQIIPGLAEQTADLIAAYGLTQKCLISSFYPSELKRVYERNPEIRKGYILSFYSPDQIFEDLERIDEIVKDCHLEFLHLPSVKKDLPSLSELCRVIKSKTGEIQFSSELFLSDNNKASLYRPENYSHLKYISADHPEELLRIRRQWVLSEDNNNIHGKIHASQVIFQKAA